jgi:hypothetical protein
MRTVLRVAPLLFVLFLFSCQAGKDGAIEGAVDPPGSQARITAISGGKEEQTVPSPAPDGTFRLALAPGTYTITVTAPGSSFPLTFDGIVVRPGETTTLPPIQLAPSVGTASLSGRVVPPQQGTEVKLLQEGKERAAVHTDSEGRYEFKEIPDGTYEVRASLPGYAEDRSPVAVAGDKVEHTAVLIPITAIDGVDWALGKIRAKGIGLPPQGSPNPTVRRAMAERAALADGRRNLLRTIEQIRLHNGRDVRTTMKAPAFAERIQGFVKGYTVVSKRESEDGTIELILELPLTGPSGLSRSIAEPIGSAKN